MSGLISIVFAILIAIAAVNISKKSAGAKKTNAKPNLSAAQKRPQGYTNYKPHKDITSVSRDMGDKKNSVLRDDRKNDWLARQLEEEHKAFKATSEMFDLKIEHASHCDARLLEQFHRKNCTATGVDLANGSTVVRKPH